MSVSRENHAMNKPAKNRAASKSSEIGHVQGVTSTEGELSKCLTDCPSSQMQQCRLLPVSPLQLPQSFLQVRYNSSVSLAQ